MTKVRLFREGRGLTRQALATMLGVSVSTVRSWETEPGRKGSRAAPGHVEAWMGTIALPWALGVYPEPPEQPTGDDLIMARAVRGWTQKRMAEECRTPLVTYCRWEQGGRVPSSMGAWLKTLDGR